MTTSWSVQRRHWKRELRGPGAAAGCLIQSRCCFQIRRNRVGGRSHSRSQVHILRRSQQRILGRSLLRMVLGSIRSRILCPMRRHCFLPSCQWPKGSHRKFGSLAMQRNQGRHSFRCSNLQKHHLDFLPVRVLHPLGLRLLLLGCLGLTDQREDGLGGR